MINKKITYLFLLFLFSFNTLKSQETEETDLGKNVQQSNAEQTSIDELNRQLENPLSRFWSIIFQENLTFNSGDMVNGTHASNVLNFQPSLPVPVGK